MNSQLRPLTDLQLASDNQWIALEVRIQLHELPHGELVTTGNGI
ncbi:MAG: hypothetical protein VKK99_03645 [Cyanobacteriota bacterium]|nr:hypothetical protein [Cyanobacteriota bacterium]